MSIKDKVPDQKSRTQVNKRLKFKGPIIIHAPATPCKTQCPPRRIRGFKSWAWRSMTSGSVILIEVEASIINISISKAQERIGQEISDKFQV